MYKLTFLGSGSAFYVGDRVGENFQSNMLLEGENGKLLIDCGTDVRFSLHEHGMKLSEITDVYISHLHADHCGGLEGLAFSTKFIPGIKKPRIYISRMFSGELWETLRGGLQSLEGELADIDTYFSVKPIKRNGAFAWDGVKFQTVQVIHVMDGFSINPSFGLFFEVDKTKVFITTDTQFAPKSSSEPLNRGYTSSRGST